MNPRMILGATLGTALLTAGLAVPAQAKPLTCHGEKATIAKHRGKVVGTPKRDVIVLTGKGRVRALAGNDLICGSSKRDVINGGRGKDRIFGGHAADTLKGGPGADQIAGEKGPDRLKGGTGSDRMYGGPGRDKAVAVTASDFYAPSGYFLDITFSQAGLTSLYASGQMIGLTAQTQISGGQVQQVLTQAWNPFQVNDVHIGGLFGVYYSQQAAGALVPGMVVQTAGQSQATPGQTLELGEVFQDPLDAGNPNAVTIQSTAGTSATYVGGLAQVTVMGEPSQMHPASVAPIAPGSEVELSPTNVVRLMLVRDGSRVGEVLSPLDLERSTTVSFSADESTQTVNYDASTGRFEPVD